MKRKRVGWRVFVLVGILAAEGLGLASFPAQPPKPDVDRVLQELQSIPVGRMKDFLGKYGLWEVDPEELYMEDILSGLIYLIAQQMGLEDYLTWYRYFDDWDDWTGIVTVQGEFGAKLWEILGIDPERDGGVLVEHVELEEMRILKKDHYRLFISCREIELILDTGFIGFEWGVGGLVLRQHYEGRRTPAGIPYTEERELFIHQVESKVRPGTYVMGAIFTRTLYRPDGAIVEVEQWYFAQGNPSPVHYGREVKGE